MKHAAFVVFALLASGCGMQEPSPTFGEELRLVKRIDDTCVYQYSNGELMQIDLNRGMKCPSTVVDEETEE